MSLAAFRLRAATLLRARGMAGTLLAAGAALWAGTLPGSVELPEAALHAAGIVLVLAFARGSVGWELRNGAALLWLQRPGRPAVLYGGRLATLAVVVPLVHLLLGTVLVGAGRVAAPSFGAAVAILLTDLALLAVAFTVSAAGPPLEPLVASAMMLLLAAPGVEAFLRPDAYGAWGPVLSALRFPTLEIQAVRSALDGGSPPTVGDVVRLAGFLCGGGGAGLLLVEARVGGFSRILRSLRRSVPARTRSRRPRSRRPPPPPSAPPP